MDTQLISKLEQEMTELVSRAVLDTTGREIEIGVEARLIRDGYLDSISMVNLVFLIQDRYGVEIDVAAINEVSFDSVKRIAAMIAATR